MDSAEQTAGERQVKALLVDSLVRRGLIRPPGQTRDQFEDMIRDICARLAYMSAGGLLALEEQCASNPGGKDRNRFPISTDILKWAATIEPPEDSASPLIRAVFAHEIGLAAIEQGHAPELLALLRRDRKWPASFALKMVRDNAEQPVRELARIESTLARGGEITQSEAAFRARRAMQMTKCREIAALARGGALA